MAFPQRNSLKKVAQTGCAKIYSRKNERTRSAVPTDLEESSNDTDLCDREFKRKWKNPLG